MVISLLAISMKTVKWLNSLDLVVREGDKEKILYKKMLNRIAGYVTRYKKRKRHSIVG